MLLHYGEFILYIHTYIHYIYVHSFPHCKGDDGHYFIVTDEG